MLLCKAVCAHACVRVRVHTCMFVGMCVCVCVCLGVYSGVVGNTAIHFFCHNHLKYFVLSLANVHTVVAAGLYLVFLLSKQYIFLSDFVLATVLSSVALWQDAFLYHYSL